MSIRMYHDQEATEELSENNPDTVRQAEEAGNDWIEEREFYLKSDDITLEYENVLVFAENNDSNLYVEYSEDGITYYDELELANGDYDEVVSIYRKVTAPNVQEAFNRENVIPVVRFDKYKE